MLENWNLASYGPSSAREMGREKITCKRKGKYDLWGLKSLIDPGGNKKATVDIIEGDDIYLENTIAKVVRGNNITIGSGCAKIDLVEYKDNLKQNEESEVGTHKKFDCTS